MTVQPGEQQPDGRKLSGGAIASLTGLGVLLIFIIQNTDRVLHEPVSKWRSARRRSSQSNAKLTRGVPGAVATGWIGAAALGGPQARALAFSRSNSDWLIAPASSSSLARAICSVGVVSPVAATSRT